MDFPAWEKFIADLDRCARGEDAQGQPLFIDDEGMEWGGILIFSEGDLEQMCMMYGLSSYNSVGKMCGWCDADRDGLPYTDLTDEAAWKPTEKMSNDVSKCLKCLIIRR